MKIRKHYAWVICAACLLMHFCAYGMTTAAFYSHMPFLRDQLGFTNTQTSFISTIRSLSTLIVMPSAVAYYKKLTLRRGVSLSCGILCAAYVVYGFAREIWTFYIGAVLMGTAFAYGTMIPISMLIQNWFQDRRATATAIATCGSSIAAAASPMLVTKMVGSWGLSRTFLTEAVFAAGCMCVLYAILRNTPKEMNTDIYREEGTEAKKAAVCSNAVASLGKKGTVLLMVIIFLCGASGTPGAAHFNIHYTTAGYPPVTAAAAVSFYGIIMTFSKFSCGVAADRFGAYRSNFFFVIMWSAGNLMNAFINGVSVPLLYIAALLEGIGVPIGTVGINVWTADLSAKEEFAKNIQRGQMLFALGGLILTPFPGMVADLTGSYGPAYLLFGTVLACVFVMIQLLYRHQRRQVRA